MNRLIWKELVEQRYVPVAYAGLLTTIIVVWFVMGNFMASHGGGANDRLDFESAVQLLFGAIPLSGLLVGSSAISNEVGSGTLSFLSALPVSRARIWWSKIIAGLSTAGMSTAMMIAAFSICIACLFGHKELGHAVSVMSVGYDGGWEVWTVIGLAFLIIFALSNLVSLFCDRPMAAAGISLIFGLSGIFSIANIAGIRDPYDLSGVLVGIGYVSFVILTTSLLIFNRGEMLRSRQRFMVALGSFAVAALIPLALFLGFLGLLRLAVSDIPVLTTWHLTPAGYGALPDKAIMSKIDIKYDRVKPGATYIGELPLCNSWSWVTMPASVKTYSPNITASIAKEAVQENGNKERVGYSVVYAYRPEWPIGGETRRINVFSASGHLIGTVDISAFKTIGVFPRQPWFGLLGSGGALRDDVRLDSGRLGVDAHLPRVEGLEKVSL